MKQILPKLTILIDIAPELERVQDFMPISGEDYQRLKDSIKKDGQRDPVKGYAGPDGRFKLLSGVNRLKACKELGLETVLTELVNIPEGERQTFAISENLDRRHFTSEQKREIIRLLLKQNPEQSDRQIAEQAKTDHKTAGKIRKEMIATGEIPQLNKTTGKDGKTRKPPEKIIVNEPEKYSPETFKADLLGILNKTNIRNKALALSKKEREKVIREVFDL